MFGFSAFGGAAFGATGESGGAPITEGWVELATDTQAEQPIQSFATDQFSNLTTAQL